MTGDGTIFDGATGLPTAHVHHDILGDHVYGMDGSAHGTVQADGFGTLHHRDASGHEFGQTSFDQLDPHHAHHHDALGRDAGHSFVDLAGHGHHFDSHGGQIGTSDRAWDGGVHAAPDPGVPAGGAFDFMNRLLKS